MIAACSISTVGMPAGFGVRVANCLEGPLHLWNNDLPNFTEPLTSIGAAHCDSKSTGAPSRSHAYPACHREERSDVAISSPEEWSIQQRDCRASLAMTIGAKLGTREPSRCVASSCNPCCRAEPAVNYQGAITTGSISLCYATLYILLPNDISTSYRGE